MRACACPVHAHTTKDRQNAGMWHTAGTWLGEDALQPSCELHCYWSKYQETTVHAQRPRIGFKGEQCRAAYLVLTLLTPALPLNVNTHFC